MTPYQAHLRSNRTRRCAKKINELSRYIREAETLAKSQKREINLDIPLAQLHRLQNRQQELAA